MPAWSPSRPRVEIFVTSTLGDAALGLCGLPSPHRAYLETRLRRPTPRVAEGLTVRGLASGGIDISDGLAADQGHLLTQSRCGCHGVPGSPAPVAGAPCTARPGPAPDLGTRRWRRLRAVLHRPATATTDARVPVARGTDDLYRSHRGQPWTAMDLRGRQRLSPPSRGLPALLGWG